MSLPSQPPSIRARLANALLVWSLLWGVGVALAVGMAARHEVDELLDESLQGAARLLVGLTASTDANAFVDAPLPVRGESSDFAWQWVDANGAVLQRSANAPAVALHPQAKAGFSSTPTWRVFGLAAGSDGRMVYAAHARTERGEAHFEVLISAALAAFSIGLLGHLWLRLRVRAELLPMERLSQRLLHHDPLHGDPALGAAERAELVPVQAAIDGLGERLARRMRHERAFTAHAAHALRTPLAGIDAQLAVALREVPDSVRPRLRRVREATDRLQRVVRSLLDLFRVGAEVQRGMVDVAALLAHLPTEGLVVAVAPGTRVDADPDLLAAALSNLLDNAQRHGASRVTIGLVAPQRLRLHDDGPGVSAERRAALRTALASQDYEGHTGLGLMLADLVARAHGGGLEIEDVEVGFAVELALAAPH